MTPDLPSTIRIVLADDHAMVRNGLQRILESEAGLRVVGQAVDGDSALARVAESGCDLILVDLTMPGASGPRLIQRLRENHPGLRILVVSMHDSAAVVRAALQAGADGYVTKDSDPEVLVEAVRCVVSGTPFIDPRVASGLDARAPAPQLALSPREQQVMQRLVAGQSNNEIAAALHLSEKTVSTHKTNLMAKLRLESLAELVRYADQHGLSGL